MAVNSWGIKYSMEHITREKKKMEKCFVFYFFSPLEVCGRFYVVEKIKLRSPKLWKKVEVFVSFCWNFNQKLLAECE